MEGAQPCAPDATGPAPHGLIPDLAGWYYTDRYLLSCDFL